jgi:acyl-CoA dehydrogenase
MEFGNDLGLAAFRQQVRDFLGTLPAGLCGRVRVGTRSPRPDLERWQRLLTARGWGAPYWPREHGGPGWTVQQQLAFDEECTAVGTPSLDTAGHRLLGPVVNHFGTPEQKAAHIPALLDARRLWCQGFSEPGSGSDLASLRTRAERSGDGTHYLVNGQKIWTSYAHFADWIFLLVRTDTQARKQAGISFLLVDMKTPGITVRPIISIDGCHHLNETFFDNVRVPVANLVGAEGEGWKITKFLLNNEHAATAELPMLRRYMATVRRLAARRGPDGSALIDRPVFAHKLARQEAALAAVAVLVHRVAAAGDDHGPAAHALGSILKIRGTELLQELSALMSEALGEHGAVAYPLPEDAAGGGAELPLQPLGLGLTNTLFFRRASTIYGGTSEVQRSIIAKSLFQF